MGDSAGGGLAAGVCLMARDRGGPPIAQQLLIYPMLDDRPTTPDPQLVPFLTWTYDDNLTGWAALLGDSAGADAVSPYAAPARATDLTGLPDTYIDVGDLDIFRNEDITYARRLSDAGVPTELHLHPGARTRSRHSPAGRMFHSEQSVIVCVACAASNLRKTRSTNNIRSVTTLDSRADIRRRSRRLRSLRSGMI